MDLSEVPLTKVEKRPMDGRLIEVVCQGEIIRLKQGPSRHGNTKPNGFMLSAQQAKSPESAIAQTIHASSEISISSILGDHLALATFRRYRFVISDPLGIATSSEHMAPPIGLSVQRSPPFAPGAYSLGYCATPTRTCPILSKICFLLATGLVGSSLGFTSDWGKG